MTGVVPAGATAMLSVLEVGFSGVGCPIAPPGLEWVSPLLARLAAGVLAALALARVATSIRDNQSRGMRSGVIVVLVTLALGVTVVWAAPGLFVSIWSLGCRSIPG